MEFLNFREMVLLEDAGNLKGLPTIFIKELTNKYNGGAAGRDSKIELYKENAKQKDVSAAARKVGGW